MLLAVGCPAEEFDCSADCRPDAAGAGGSADGVGREAGGDDLRGVVLVAVVAEDAEIAGGADDDGNGAGKFCH